MYKIPPGGRGSIASSRPNKLDNLKFACSWFGYNSFQKVNIKEADQIAAMLFACIKLDFLASVAIYFEFREVNVRKSYLSLIVFMYTTFLVHRIRISEIYPGIENLSYPCYLTQDVKLRHCYVILAYFWRSGSLF